MIWTLWLFFFLMTSMVGGIKTGGVCFIISKALYRLNLWPFSNYCLSTSLTPRCLYLFMDWISDILRTPGEEVQWHELSSLLSEVGAKSCIMQIVWHCPHHTRCGLGRDSLRVSCCSYMVHSSLTEMIVIKLNDKSKPVKCVEMSVPMVLHRVKPPGLIGRWSTLHGDLYYNGLLIGIYIFREAFLNFSHRQKGNLSQQTFTQLQRVLGRHKLTRL